MPKHVREAPKEPVSPVADLLVALRAELERRAKKTVFLNAAADESPCADEGFLRSEGAVLGFTESDSFSASGRVEAYAALAVAWISHSFH